MKANVRVAGVFDTGMPIASVDIHPTKPWLLTASDGGAILLYDYSRNSIIQQWHASTLDPGEHTGILQSVFFYDSAVLRWKWLTSAVNKDLEAFQGKRCRRSWIAVLCDNKVCLLDYVTRDVTAVRQSVFEERWLTALEIIDSTYLAVGCSDGSIRLWDSSERRVIKVFPRGAHTKAVTVLKTFSQNVRQRPLLLAAGLCGAVTVWNLDTSDEMPAYRLQSSGPAVQSLTLSQSLLRVAILFSDKSLVVFNLTNAQESSRHKNLKDSKKRVISSVCFFPHILHPPSSVLTHCKSSQVLSLDLSASAKSPPPCQPLIDLAPLLGDVKLTDIKVHPLQPWVVFCVATSSVAIVYYEQTANAPGCYSDSFFTTLSPSQVQTFADHSGNPVGMETNNFFYSFFESFLCTNTFKLTTDGVVSKACKLTNSGKQMLVAPFLMTLSPSCLYLVLHSKSTGYYEIYKLGEEPTPLSIPERLKSGSAKCLVWSRTKDRFAVLSPVNDDGMLGSFVGKYVALVIILYEVNKEGQIFMLFRGDSIPHITSLHGGSLLGVTEAPPDGRELTRFWSWETMVPPTQRDSGLALPPPSHVLWSDSHLCVCYPSELYLYSIQGDHTLKGVSRLQESVISAVWLHGVLFYVTGRGVKWLHPGMSAGVEGVSHALQVEEELKMDVVERKGGKIGRKQMGAVTLLGIVDGQLLLLDQFLRPTAYPLDFPVLQFALLLETHLEEEALRLLRSLSPSDQRECFSILLSKGLGKLALESINDSVLSGFVPAKGIPIPAEKLKTVELVFAQAVSNPSLDYLRSLQSELVDQKDYEKALAVAAVINNAKNTLKTLMMAEKLGRAWALAATMENGQ